MDNRRERFKEEYLVDLNGTQAAIRAGYSARSADVTASRLLGDDRIVRDIAAAMAKRTDRVEVKSDYVVAVLVDTIERCRQAVAVLDREGNPTGEWRFDANAVLRGCELLGKHVGMYIERHQIEHLDINRALELAKEADRRNKLVGTRTGGREEGY